MKETIRARAITETLYHCLSINTFRARRFFSEDVQKMPDCCQKKCVNNARSFYYSITLICKVPAQTEKVWVN